MNRLTFCLVALALPLAACGSQNRDEGTTITLNASDADGNVTAAMDGETGKVSLDLPGFSANIDLPKIQLDASDFDLNGVHLYPGSQITTVNIDGKNDNGAVRIGFDSPAAPETVRDWFAPRLKDAGFTVRTEGTGLAGTTDEGKPFGMALVPADGGHTTGTITLSD
jgi:hypothetical protein